MPSVSTHIALTLAAHVDHVFGVMGNGNAYLLDALARHTDTGYTAVRHEAGAVVAADAHFRASNRIAAATTTYGAGFTNALTALAESVQAHVPLIMLVGDEPTPARARGTSTRSRSPPPSAPAPTPWAAPTRLPPSSSHSSTPSRTACPSCWRSRTTSPPSTPGRSRPSPGLVFPNRSPRR
ncbi:thiamine pyrophosphate-binding protein [Tsukamurella soli]|uniref:thiamine pyrophosphate-binding protein n=1 Tax=Tsukamurella soli TaxID=644556 RepID=UPI003618EBC5